MSPWWKQTQQPPTGCDSTVIDLVQQGAMRDAFLFQWSLPGSSTETTYMPRSRIGICAMLGPKCIKTA